MVQVRFEIPLCYDLSMMAIRCCVFSFKSGDLTGSNSFVKSSRKNFLYISGRPELKLERVWRRWLLLRSVSGLEWPRSLNLALNDYSSGVYSIESSGLSATRFGTLLLFSCPYRLKC